MTFAFPHTWVSPQTKTTHVAQGMTLRDYFAAKAMQAMIKYGPWSDYVDMEQIARLAYQQADAMMKAREA